jgi:hypothetical protein
MSLSCIKNNSLTYSVTPASLEANLFDRGVILITTVRKNMKAKQAKPQFD